VIGGAQKCGTTQLHNLLIAHPQLFLPRRPQELHYFDLQYDRGMRWYASHFQQVSAEQKIGQTSPLYLFDKGVPERMERDLPGAKLIFVLRDPVRRAYSHYWHQVKKGSESESFAQALALEPMRLKGSGADRRRYSYVARGLYLEQLERFGAWPRDRIRIVLFEELISNPGAVVDSLCVFLGVERRGADCVARARKQSNRAALPRSTRVQQLVRRVRPRAPRLARAIELLNLKPVRYPAMDPVVCSELAEVFREPNQALAEQFQLDLSGWTSAEG